MGQKVNPIGLRLGYIAEHDSRWFVRKKFGAVLAEDMAIRRTIIKAVSAAGVSKVTIERASANVEENIRVTIHAARPGLIIGQGGTEIEKLRGTLRRHIRKEIALKIQDIRNPDLDAALLAQGVCDQLLRRIPFRRAMKRAVTSALKAGAKGVRVCASGRLGGAEMSRREWYQEGRVPLQTLRAEIDYNLAEAFAPYGVIGVKVWLYKGDKYV